MDNYINTEACGEDVPKRIKDFSIKWHSNNAWRGFYEAIPTKKSKWQEIESSWVTGDWSDAGENSSSCVKQKLDDLYNKFLSENKEMIVMLTPTSNIFSTNYQVFIR
jgi:hypothetical protein